MSAVQLLSNSLAVLPNVPTPFDASGGTPPYTFTVLEGGAGGSIDSDGLYTAPAGYGIDIVQVEDSLGSFAQTKIVVDSPIQLMCDIIQNQMGLSPGQVYVYNQKINIPTDNKIYIAVGVISCKPFSNSNKSYGVGSGFQSIQSTNFQATLSVDILSKSIDALNRKEEIILALMSQYSETQQELNGFYIAKISSAFVNLSEIDGAAIPYRFNISINIQYQITKTQPVDYFDSFQPDSVITNS